MEPIIFLLAFVTFISTMAGGIIILRFKSSLPYFFAFSAGSLIGVAFLEILPESLEIAQSASLPVRTIYMAIVISFFAYSLIERFFLTHHIEEHSSHAHIMGPIGAGSLIIHSFVDGAAIGAAYHVKPALGLVVALAVISHDFTDGINTVVVMLKNRQKSKKTIIFLLLDAVAPVAGILVVSLIPIPIKTLAIILAVFVGEFIYLGASSLLPETHHHNPIRITLAMAFGILVVMILSGII